jgi:hypothetical protein
VLPLLSSALPELSSGSAQLWLSSTLAQLWLSSALPQLSSTRSQLWICMVSDFTWSASCRTHKCREARRYRLKAHIKELQRENHVISLTETINAQRVQIDDLHKRLGSLGSMAMQSLLSAPCQTQAGQQMQTTQMNYFASEALQRSDAMLADHEQMDSAAQPGNSSMSEDDLFLGSL